MSQVAGDLRTVVARRCGLKRRVALLSSDPGLVKALEANGCEVLVDPGSLAELGQFSPEVVVAFDGFLTSDGASGFRALADAAPSAELVFSFANAASASGLLQALTGGDRPRAVSAPELEAWLASAGYQVTGRDAVVTAFRPSGLAPDTEAALRQLFEQLNPSSAVERFVVVAKRALVASAPDRVEGLVSVVLTGDDEPGLAGTVASLLGQRQRPLELILSTSWAGERAEALLEKARGRAKVSTVCVHASTEAAQLNLGLERARGQYLAFAPAGALFAPLHLSSLVERLSQGMAAWALAPSKESRFSLPGRLRAGRVHRAEWLLDRSRLGRFPLTFADGVRFHDALLFTRLALLFTPATERGAATVDEPEATPVALDELLTALQARPLRGLTSLDELLRASEPPSLEAVVDARFGNADPRAKAAYERAKGLVHRVSQAWDDAKKTK